MAERRDVIWLHHPGTGAEYAAITEQQAKVLAKSGWKKGKAKAKSTTEEK